MELLVALGVVGLLAAIALPSYAAIIERQKVSQARVELIEIDFRPPWRLVGEVGGAAIFVESQAHAPRIRIEGEVMEPRHSGPAGRHARRLCGRTIAAIARPLRRI